MTVTLGPGRRLPMSSSPRGAGRSDPARRASAVRVTAHEELGLVFDLASDCGGNVPVVFSVGFTD